MSILQRSVLDLKGVGQQLATRLAKLHIQTFQDILFHLPTKYVDRTRIHPLSTVRIDDQVVIEGLIESVSVIPKPKRSLSVKIRDSSGRAELRFFYFNQNQQAQLRVGLTVRCFGQARHNRNGLQFIHPEYKIIDANIIMPVEELLTPIYPTTEGVSQKLLGSLVKQVMTVLLPIKKSLDLLPETIRNDFQFGDLLDCLHAMHFPSPGFTLSSRYLAFEELLAQHLSLRLKRQQINKFLARKIVNSGKLALQLRANLPFALTGAQERTIATVLQDLAQPHPMLRLVQGDVGSGKTLVAVIAALAVIEAGYQVAFMAPTEILVEQHYKNIKTWFAPLGIEVACLKGSLNNKEKMLINTALKENQIKLIVGTHALFQESVEFANLALVIMDEQHRFGVAQRLALQKKGSMEQYSSHQLILTATPIPRTLAMTYYADLDYSIIDELPPGRKAITTVLISAERRAEVLARIAALCAQGQQVYWVCTLIEESEVLDCTAAENVWQELQQQLPNLQIALIHGRMKAEQKEQIMHDFKSGAINLLVATTVIEVGVDVPNATLMVIENPERLGLAQLHQLRGRVGRGAAQSYCVLLYKRPLGERSMQRLQFMRESQDGFALAEFDLKLRGPGEFFGTRQSGLAPLRIADIVRDRDLLPKVAAAAEVILNSHKEIVPLLLQRWVRDQVQYAEV